MEPHPYASDLAAIARIDVIPTILDVVCRTTGMGFSAVARVTEEHWVACAVRDDIGFGLTPGGELPIETTICNEIRQCGQLVVIDEVKTDEKFREHPTPKLYGFQSYISVPIWRPGGAFFGTLCSIDPRPARVNNVQTIETFRLFADLIGRHLDAGDRLAASESALATAQERAHLQNQFVAVLSHDLRNPVSAIRMGARVLSAMPLEPRGAQITAMIERSTARIAGLIDNVMDFARTRLGGGLTIDVRQDPRLADMLEHVVTEIRTAHADRVIESDIVLADPVACDPDRVGQLLSNLLTNAVTHGDPAGPVRVRARSGPDGFELSVANRGGPIAPDVAERLFEPFVRGRDVATAQGLGLGLFITAEIARAHRGSMSVSSEGDETRFTFLTPA